MCMYNICGMAPFILWSSFFCKIAKSFQLKNTQKVNQELFVPIEMETYIGVNF